MIVRALTATGVRGLSLIYDISLLIIAGLERYEVRKLTCKDEIGIKVIKCSDPWLWSERRRGSGKGKSGESTLEVAPG